jgi:diguanylate cyclase (GGDEF)-like protein/PAS domain S-box-containing protein
MKKNAARPSPFLDSIGLLIVGLGASAVYFYFEKMMNASQDLTVFITIALILLISLFTQFLLNNINRSKEALRVANETLELKVRERTAELRESETKYRTIFENTGTATIIVDRDRTISLANSEFVQISGYPRDQIETKKQWLDFIDQKSQRKLLSMMFEPSDEESPVNVIKNFECLFIDREQHQRDILLTFETIPGISKSVVSLADVSQLKEAERQIYNQAFHDTLTLLPNRALFMEHLTMAIKRSHRRRSYSFAVLYLDIDRFKLVNDSLGHTVGDDLLVAFAERIKSNLRDIDTLARLGGDEFVILLEDIESSEYVSGVADRIQKALREPFQLSGKEVFAPASFGVVLKTEDYDQPENIIRDADAAMYHAKEAGKAQYKIFDKRLHEKAMHLLQRETDLRKAIDRREFETCYQPIVDLQTASVVGFEALIRWRHPDLGLVMPGAFISIAEETGLIMPITRLVVEKACRDLQLWQDSLQDIQRLTVNVNISSKHFLLPSLLEDLKEILDLTGLPSDQLKLEITETALMEDATETIRLVHRLKEFGLQLVIDDFGTGYSSLSYLQRLPIDTLKVDRSFVSQIHGQPDGNRNIVEAIISLAHRLNMVVVAEGVETPLQYAILMDMQCEYGQGYLFSHPLTKEEVDQLIERILQFSRNHPDRPYSLTDCLAN